LNLNNWTVQLLYYLYYFCEDVFFNIKSKTSLIKDVWNALKMFFDFENYKLNLTYLFIFLVLHLFQNCGWKYLNVDRSFFKEHCVLQIIVVVDVILFDKCVSLYIERINSEMLHITYFFLPFKPYLVKLTQLFCDIMEKKP